MDEQEFRPLYDATARSILAYLIGVTGRRDVADDVLQETYCRYLIRHANSSATRAMDANETRRYLFRVATNLLRDRWRSGVGRHTAELPDEGRRIDFHSANLDTQLNTQLAIHQVMQALKPRERELLWLAYVEGMSHSEIAAATGLGATSVKLLLFRARRKAAALLRPGAATAMGEETA